MQRPPIPRFRIGPLREARGWTKRYLAKATGCSPTFIRLVERGDCAPSAGMLQRLARVFEVPVDDLFASEPQEKEKSNTSPPMVADHSVL